MLETMELIHAGTCGHLCTQIERLYEISLSYPKITVSVVEDIRRLLIILNPSVCNYMHNHIVTAFLLFFGYSSEL